MDEVNVGAVVCYLVLCAVLPWLFPGVFRFGQLQKP